MHYRTLLLTLALLLAFGGIAAAQDDGAFTPTVEVSNQVSTDGTVLIDRAVSDGPGWLVIHADNDGAPGEVLGFRGVNAGENVRFKINIDVSAATPVLFAMLHFDNSEVGTYEFPDGGEGIDGPIVIDGNVLAPTFAIDAVLPQDQFVQDSTVNIPAVVAQNDGWVVVHADSDGAPGDVLGATFVEAGLNTNVPVELDAEATDTLHPMLHEDTGASGQYEFGRVDGADLPVVVEGVVATANFKTVPSVIANQQIVFDTFVAESVLSEGPGWLVIHADGGGVPGQVIGAQFVEAGYNADVAVSLNTDAGITPVVYPMLHEDTGAEGEYEFGEVDGADLPVQVNGSVLTFPMLVAPSFTALAQPVQDNGSINIATVLIDSPGWLVIHEDNGEGRPGAVIGFAPLLAGLNENVGVLLTEDPTPTVFPMLHYDTDAMGVYEFGQVEGADAPVRVGGEIVVGPLELQNVE